MSNPTIKFTLENGKEIIAELYPETAPITVENFLKLINEKFYDGLIFHRVIKDFMIQGGCPKGTGTGGPGYTIKGEFSQNGVKNDIKHAPGVLSMARAMDPDSAGSQFFIMTSNSPHLDGAYAAFGQVTSGMEAVREIESAATPRSELTAGKSVYELLDENGELVSVNEGNADKPLKTIRIKEARVLSDGKDS